MFLKDHVRKHERAHGRSVLLRRHVNTILLGGGSTNNRSLRKVSRDAYYSGPELSEVVRRIVERKSKHIMKIIDPCAGKKQLTPKGAVAADIHPMVPGVKKVNFLRATLADYGVRKKGKLMFVMNPPFLIGRKNGWKLFMNKAADLCRDRPGSYIVCVCYETKSDITRIHKIDRHLHPIEEHRFDRDSEAHLFTTGRNKTKRVPIVVQVWKWKRALRPRTPFEKYTGPSKNIPFSFTNSPHQRYYLKLWNSPAQVGDIMRKTSIKKQKSRKKGHYVMNLHSLVRDQPTTGSLQADGGTIVGLKIKQGHVRPVVDWFKHMFRRKLWVSQDTALSNRTLSIKWIYFAYETRPRRLPTVDKVFRTKIVHHP